MKELALDKTGDQKLHLPDADITYIANFISTETATTYFNSLKNEISWQQDPIKVFGKVYMQPRLTALYGTEGKSYSYSGLTMSPKPFAPLLLKIKTRVENVSNTTFNTILLNLYRDGSDSNGWHSDDENELGKNPCIASLSLGAERFFHLKNKAHPTDRYKILLKNGSLLLMQGTTQHHWQHQIPKTKKASMPRINLTFRNIK